MLLVVDANIIFSALIAGRLTDLLLSKRLELVAPELLFTETRKHEKGLRAKSRLSDIEFDILLVLLGKKIRIVPMGEILPFMSRAKKLLGEHTKDAPYFALALRLKCPVWSYEERFDSIDSVESLTTKDVRSRLYGDDFSGIGKREVSNRRLSEKVKGLLKPSDKLPMPKKDTLKKGEDENLP